MEIATIPNYLGEPDFEYVDPEGSNIVQLDRFGAKKLKTWKTNEEKTFGLTDSQLEDLKEKGSSILSPKFQLNGEKLNIVKFSSELLLNLDLMLKYNNLGVIPDYYNFDETLSYNNNERSRFQNIIINKGGYLLEDSNFFSVDSNQLSGYTKLTTLRNSRVSLFWRDVELTEVNIKRILTLGLTFLLGIISQAELVFEINKEIKNDNYVVSIKFEKDRFIRIGIEAPTFSY